MSPFTRLIGANYRSRVLVNDYIRPKPFDHILDIGCGPGNMLPFLSECQYIGFDVNESYIASARERYGDCGDFVCQRVNHHTVERFGVFDIVLALGLVHHLDDSEAKHLFCLGHAALKPGGAGLLTMVVIHLASQLPNDFCSLAIEGDMFEVNKNIWNSP